MKSNIDKIIKTGAKQESIPLGHEERFLEKLRQQKREKSTQKPRGLKFPRKKALAIVMSAVAVLLLMVTFFNPISTMQSEVKCDEICEFIAYSDRSIYSLQSELIAKAIDKLLPEDLTELENDLVVMIEEYNMSKEQQNTMAEEEFLGFMFNVYQQQVESLDYINEVIN